MTTGTGTMQMVMRSYAQNDVRDFLPRSANCGQMKKKLIHCIQSTNDEQEEWEESVQGEHSFDAFTFFFVNMTQRGLLSLHLLCFRFSLHPVDEARSREIVMSMHNQDENSTAEGIRTELHIMRISFRTRFLFISQLFAEGFPPIPARTYWWTVFLFMYNSYFHATEA